MARKSIEKGISFDPEKGLYYAYLAMGGSTGVYKTTKTKKEAKRLRKEHAAKKQRGEVLPVNEDTLVGRTEALIEQKSLRLAKSTIYAYRGMLNNHIKPYFKNRRIQDISSSDIEKYIFCKAKNLGNSTIQKHLDLMNAVFDKAKKNRIILENPMEFVERVGAKSTEQAFYTIEEMRKLLDSVKGTPIELAVYLAGFMGLRRGEVAGLKWSDVDLEERVISINNSRTQVGSEVDEKKPKTDRGIRKLGIPDEVYEALVREKNKPIKKGSMSERTVKHDYVVTMKNGKPFRPNYISDCFNAHIKKHKLKPITYHGLRHTFATIASHSGASINELSSALGHANIAVTYGVYTHMIDAVRSEATEKVAQSLSESKTPMNHDEEPGT